jgi:hypothetical protein
MFPPFSGNQQPKNQTLSIGAASSRKTPGNIYQSTWRYISETLMFNKESILNYYVINPFAFIFHKS